jgi:hypothetical protein
MWTFIRQRNKSSFIVFLQIDLLFGRASIVINRAQVVKPFVSALFLSFPHTFISRRECNKRKILARIAHLTLQAPAIESFEMTM